MTRSSSHGVSCRAPALARQCAISSSRVTVATVPRRDGLTASRLQVGAGLLETWEKTFGWCGGFPPGGAP
jgi:hypothetical protein